MMAKHSRYCIEIYVAFFPYFTVIKDHFQLIFLNQKSNLKDKAVFQEGNFSNKWLEWKPTTTKYTFRAFKIDIGRRPAQESQC